MHDRLFLLRHKISVFVRAAAVARVIKESVHLAQIGLSSMKQTAVEHEGITWAANQKV